MRKHYANVHPGKDPSAAISEEEHREIRKANRSSVPPFYTRRSFHVAALVIVVLVAAFVGLPYILHGLPSGNLDIVGYCGVEGTVEHYHPLLVINDNGVQQPLPYDPNAGADVGGLNQPGYTNPSYYCPGGQIHLLHTHDGSGIIHVELPQVVSPSPTLAQFFEIWGEPLSSGAVWTFSGHVTATMYNSDTGKVTDYSSNPGGIPLYEPAAGPQGNAYPIPQQWIFNAAYGNGQSGGTFSGEIIWLNVTA